MNNETRPADMIRADIASVRRMKRAFVHRDPKACAYPLSNNESVFVANCDARLEGLVFEFARAIDVDPNELMFGSMRHLVPADELCDCEICVSFNAGEYDEKKRSEIVTYWSRMNKLADRPVHVLCLECDKKFWSRSLLPECPRCGGGDFEVV